jgi:small-conductance mechanosensitive channel
MNRFFEYIYTNIEKFIPLGRTIITVIVTLIIFDIILNLSRKTLLKGIKTKKQRSNVKIFSKVLKYIFFILIVISAIFSYAGSWTGWGLTVGLFSAALGWALQKPITGIAAWIMIVSKRPFEIGDRIIIGNVRGDVVDITLTHIYIAEIGGLVAGEETSGRIIMVPNAIMFEQNITNYTSKDEHILDQVAVNITFESNLEKAEKMILGAASKFTKEIIKKTNKKPYTRIYFKPNGVDLRVRYFAPAKQLQEISSNISKEIYIKIIKTKGINFAYPHNDVIISKKR